VTRYLLLIVASLALGTGITGTALAQSTDSGARTSDAEATLNPNEDTSPVDPKDPNGSGNEFPGEGTDSTGKLTLDYVSNLNFVQQGISGTQIVSNATNTKAFVQISDRRSTGAGWQLQVKPSALVGDKDSTAISQASIELGAARFIPSGKNVSGTPSVVATSTQLLPIGSYSLIGRAGKNTGMGTWIMNLNYDASAPTELLVMSAAVTQQQTYRGTLSWLLSDTPQ